MSEKKVRIGIIGNGSIAHAAHFPAFSAIDGVEIVSLLARDYNNAVQSAIGFGIPNVAHDLDESLRQDLDAAVLLTQKTVRRE